MIINGFGGHSAGPVDSPELLTSITTTLNQTETISAQTYWPSSGNGSSTTEYHANYYKLASLTSATSGLTSQIPQLLSYTQNLMVDIVVTAITPPTITYSITSSVVSGSIWPFRISVATGLNNAAYNFMNCYYRDCNQVAATGTVTINTANYGTLSMLSSRKFLPSIYCMGYGNQGSGSYAISVTYSTGDLTSWGSTTTPNFGFINTNYGGMYLVLYDNMSSVGSNIKNPTNFAASGASATIRFDIYRSY